MCSNTDAASNFGIITTERAVDQVEQRVAAHGRVIVRAGHQVRAPAVEAHRVTEAAQQIEISVDRRG